MSFPGHIRMTVVAALLIITASECITAAESNEGEPILNDTLIYGDSILDHFVRLVDAAERSILIATYKLTSEKALNALLKAGERGVDVRLLVDNNAADKKNSLVISAEKNGLNVRRWQTDRLGKLHAKIYIFDKMTVALGSFNLSESAGTTNQEVLLLTQDRGIVEQALAFWRTLDEQAGE